ncbi:phage tail protein [Sphingomonas pokkalii]|uniref:Phage tail protein n=1 Tax=Sphingomonas pokkalii TaxID=2175090 RepID=A0A2U0SFE2_9SPHN|nr:phage tail protein [Sphingomonas pokkalii]PVX30077.1 phage tail protein [Sphingomonas pokkalii]
MASNYYPPPAFSFAVAIASMASVPMDANIDAAFQEVSGIDPKVDLEEVREGGVNDYVHQLPGVTKHSNLVLKRGYVTKDSPLADWAAQTVGSTLGTPIQTQTITIFLLGPTGQALVTWTFLNAWPVKWEVGTLDSTNTSSVLTQTLEISYSTVTSALS